MRKIVLWAGFGVIVVACGGELSDLSEGPDSSGSTRDAGPGASARGRTHRRAKAKGDGGAGALATGDAAVSPGDDDDDGPSDPGDDDDVPPIVEDDASAPPPTEEPPSEEPPEQVDAAAPPPVHSGPNPCGPERIVVRMDGSPTTYDAIGPSISDDGRFVAFVSADPLLVPNDTNGVADVFVRDRVLGTTERVNVANGGAEANGSSIRSTAVTAISADGRFVAFYSEATNLGAPAAMGSYNIYLHDRQTHTTEWVSVSPKASSLGAYAFSLSADGRFVAFAEGGDLYRRDRTHGTTELAKFDEHNAPIGWSVAHDFSLSGDGRYLAFSQAVTTAGAANTIYIRDFVTGTTRAIASPGMTRQGYLALSSDGQSLLYYAQQGSESVHVHVAVATGATTIVDRKAQAYGGAISGSGILALPTSTPRVAEDSNPGRDLYVVDPATNVSTLVSWGRNGYASGLTTAGTGGRGVAISRDAKFIAYTTNANNILSNDTNGTIDVVFQCVGHWVDAPTTPVEPIDAGVAPPPPPPPPEPTDAGPRTADGSIPCDLERVNLNYDRSEVAAATSGPSISDDGRYVAFTSVSTTMVPNDHNGTADAFVHDRLYGVTERVSVSSTGVEGNDSSADSWSGTAMSGDGRYVTFRSRASNLGAPASAQPGQLFLRDRVARTTEWISVPRPGEAATPVQGNVITRDGRYVLFERDNNTLYRRDRATGVTELAGILDTGATSQWVHPLFSMSDDGRYVAFSSTPKNSSDTSNNPSTVYVRDMVAGTTRAYRSSTYFDGRAPFISGDGETLVIYGRANNDYLVYRVVRSTGATTEIAGGAAIVTAVSYDGRYTAIQTTLSFSPSDANARTTGYDLYVYDASNATYQLVTVGLNGWSTGGTSANGRSLSMSRDGKHVAFHAGASNLVAGDQNRVVDTFAGCVAR